MEIIMQTKFKVGDQVRCVRDYLRNITLNHVYTIFRVQDGRCFIHTDSGSVGVYPAYIFELAEHNPVLTPEEVFEHLRKGTKLQYKQEASPKGWRDCSNPQFANILNREWRIKPEPEVIELNGKRYKLIEE